MNQPLLTTIKHIGLIFTAAIFNIFAAAVHAQPIQGIAFSHHDWELACDNTGTCRAAGYEAFGEEGDLGISVLLTRAAGANQAVSGELYVRDFDDENILPLTIQFQIGNKSHGTIDYQSAPTALSAAQVQALLNAARTDQPIVFSDGNEQGILSGQGMSAVFLKMDEFQNRVGTTGAMIRPGSKPETGVLQPRPVPELLIPPTRDEDETLKQYYLNQQEKLIALTQDTYAEECFLREDQAQTLDIYPLNDQHALLSRSCWSAAYNTGDAFWLIDRDLNSAQLITSMATGYENGQIFVGQKGRGIGDCWYVETHSWNGKQLVATQMASTGMCKGQPGGFWLLPTVVYDVKHANP
ncbi:hypothetical protein CUZ56_02585 [Saezia sanguinis]|uniref:DUF1176 domain-containing protein n=1 Tax=Saezia sanguinis TaxID=1965230 RepID=A0A433SAI3_9BURK|nr:DUF1176 domain-containing protein [Saezia sanguinis]RUS65740.1 hypothetical protein CUZ56_02585 [Saezia sanguinis]